MWAGWRQEGWGGGERGGEEGRGRRWGEVMAGSALDVGKLASRVKAEGVGGEEGRGRRRVGGGSRGGAVSGGRRVLCLTELKLRN